MYGETVPKIWSELWMEKMDMYVLLKRQGDSIVESGNCCSVPSVANIFRIPPNSLMVVAKCKHTPIFKKPYCNYL